MRPMEIVLSAANITAFVALLFPSLRGSPVARYIILAGLASATAAQALVEGPRAQMVPAYVLSGIFLAIWLAQAWLPSLNLSIPRLASVLAVGMGLLGLVAASALPALLPVFQFPRPSGPHGIGTLTYHWVDQGRHEIFSTDPAARRELMVQVWYPADADPSARRAAYLPEAKTIVPIMARWFNKPELLFGNLQYIKTHAVESAAMAGAEPRYPVIILLEGLGAVRQVNTFQVEELVSHGYVVAALDLPYASTAVAFPDGRVVTAPPIDVVRPLVRQSYLPYETAPVLKGQVYQKGVVPYFAQDAVFALDQLTALNAADPRGILTGRLDMQHVGVIGFSLGGIVASEACRIDTRLGACLFLDAPMMTSTAKAGLTQAAMWITRDAAYMRLERERAGGWPEEDIAAQNNSARAVYDSLPAEGYFVQIPDIFHINFGDVPLWSPIFYWAGMVGPIDPQRGHSIINAYTLAFFDRELKEAPASRFDSLVEVYPDVRLEMRLEKGSK